MPELTPLQNEVLLRFFERRDEFKIVCDAMMKMKTCECAPACQEGRIVIDSPVEILANKLCALLSRAELRDLVDVSRLEQSGHDPVAAVTLAQQKDGGMSHGQLAWVLSRFPLPSDESLHYGMTITELKEYRDSLIDRLSASAFPSESE